jgi:hypothetical protein
MSQIATPSEQLAVLTVDKLILAGQLRATRRQALIAKISAGTMTTEDWQVEFELAYAKEEDQ